MPSLSTEVTEQAAASDTVTVKVIANFAWQHMKAATLFRERTQVLEQENSANGFGSHIEEIRSYVSACIMSTAASLEALVNELFIASNSPLRERFDNFEANFWGRGNFEHKQTLEKYQHALELVEASPLDENEATYQDVRHIFFLRNQLIHFKPTWDDERETTASLTNYLRGKYSISPFLTDRDDFITLQSMSFGCCDWVVAAAYRFLHEFDSRTRLDDGKMAGFWMIEPRH